ncbi:hypothetical protein [Methanobacterium sp.]|uniref:hypothetical protein n=1 Tax=Methanobacterium sp. TaxID=2164 RepID=UPI00315853EF
MHGISKNLLKVALATVICIFVFLPAAEAHILVVSDVNNYDEASQIVKTLKSKGYSVLWLYGKNATTKNIIKGMYKADAVIYEGHGGYESGNYDQNGGTASPPFALIGSDGFVWGVGNQMSTGLGHKTFKAPFKKNIPVILLHACFSDGWVENNEVANPTATVYNFARMFTGAGANYYATGWSGAEIIYDFLGGATSFADANNKNFEKITKSTSYNGTLVWRNDHGIAAFVGNWNGKFPTAAQTTPYNDAAAEKWYDSNVAGNVFDGIPNLDLVTSNVYKSWNYLCITLQNDLNHFFKLVKGAIGNYY